MKAASFLSLLVLCCFCFSGYARTSKKIKQAQLFATSSDMSENAAGENTIKLIRSSGRKSKTLVVKYKDGTKKEILKSTLWGFRSNNGQCFRIYDNRLYSIIKENAIIVYNSDKGKYCFSKDRGTPILSLTNDNLKATLDDSTYDSIMPEVRGLRAKKACVIIVACLCGAIAGALAY